MKEKGRRREERNRGGRGRLDQGASSWQGKAAGVIKIETGTFLADGGGSISSDSNNSSDNNSSSSSNGSCGGGFV